jgi:RimJ/RimL family protein N-acetyltransferase
MRNNTSIKLNKVKKSDALFLYDLLRERDPRANISHRKMPSYEEHVKFILSNPYKIWYVIYLGNTKSGSIYLSKQNEIGIFILAKYQGKNIGKQALQLLMKKNPESRYLANVNPKNRKSINFFKKNKFTLIQHTYEFIPSEIS